MTSVEAITKTTVPGNYEFVLHVPSEYDYRFVGETRDEIIQVMKEVYLQALGKNLPIYGIQNKHLKDYVTTKADRKKNIFRVPEESFRLLGENLITEEALKSGSDDAFDVQKIAGKLIYCRSKETESTKMENFKFVKILNKTPYERNCLVEHVTTQKLFTVKEIKKDSLLDTDKITSAKIEVEVAKCDHPFLASPEFVFQASTGIYLFFEFLCGGDLLQLLSKYKRIPEKQAQFYTTQLTLALTKLHSNKIVFKELRPETIQFDTKGYISLNAFSIHRFLDDEKKRQQIATSEANSPHQQEYFAPEVSTGESIAPALDWWALGIVLYEMLVGIPPFFAQDQRMLKQYIASKDVKYPDPIKHHILVSDSAREMITKVWSGPLMYA